MRLSDFEKDKVKDKIEVTKQQQAEIQKVFDSRITPHENHILFEFDLKKTIAEFLIEAYDLKVGDTVLIQGPTTGSQEMVLDSMRVDEKPNAEKATKSDVVTFKTDFKVRPSDKLYKIVAAD